jgi:hypothetical protein
MTSLPVYLPAGFLFIVAIAVFLLHRAFGKSRLVLTVTLSWILIQSAVSFTGFYVNELTLPPRMLLLVGPALIGIVLLFATGRGRNLLRNTDARYLTLIHAIRVPVELALFGLFVHGAIPRIMTFEGRNLDILAGLTAPVIFYFGFVKKNLSPRLLLLWNCAALCLVLNITFHGILSVPTRFQQFGFEQPNVALLHFPFTLLPGFLVPLVIVSHLVVLQQLMMSTKKPIMSETAG